MMRELKSVWISCVHEKVDFETGKAWECKYKDSVKGI